LKRPTVNKDDHYFGKIIKYIPTEVVAGYVTLSGFVKVLHPPHSQFTWFCILSIGLLVLTPLYFLVSTSASINSYRHAVAGTIAFAVWVFATGGTVSSLLWERQRLLVFSGYRIDSIGPDLPYVTLY